jgi:hypothetical protein
MTGESPSPAARRVRRPSWRDPRLGVGLLLVAGSVALGSWVVADAGRGERFYAAAEALTPGETLTPATLVVVEARLGDAAAAYLRADAPPEEGAVATRVVAEGELVPASAVGSVADVGVRPVGVPVDGPLGSAVTPGSAVDLWATTPPATGVGVPATPAEPRLVAGALVVAGVVEDDDLFSAGARTVVEVLVPDAELPAVLAAVAGDAAITLVPVAGER